jgi:hypothetical protein
MLAPRKISEAPDCSSSTIARQWLVKFGEICQKEVSSTLFAIWDEQLRDIPPELLDRACDRLAKTWQSGFLPTPGNVRAQIATVDAKGLQVEAEEAWQRALRHAREYFGARFVPDLDAASEHSVRAAGGLAFIEGCSESELVWAKKRFVEDFNRLRETGESAHLLTRGEARRILQQITASTERPALTVPKLSELGTTEKVSDADLEEATARARAKIFATPADKAEEEIEDRRAELQRQAEIIRTKYANPRAAVEVTGGT